MQQAEIYIRSGDRIVGQEIIDNIYESRINLTGQQKRRVALARVILLLKDGSYGEALELCKAIINQYKSEEKAWNYLVDILDIQDREVEAEKVLISGIANCKDKFQLKEKLFGKYLIQAVSMMR